jgi:hypothetical protein
MRPPPALVVLALASCNAPQSSHLFGQEAKAKSERASETRIGAEQVAHVQSNELTWFKLKASPRCLELVERTPCLERVQSPSLIVLSKQKIYDPVFSISGIGGEVICYSFCLSNNESFLFREDLRDRISRAAFVRKGDRLIGMIVQIADQDGGISSRFYLTVAGSRLSLNEIKQALSSAVSIET